VRAPLIGDKPAPMMEAATAVPGKQVRDLLQDALNHLNRADFAKGEDALLNTLSQHPGEPDALQLLGVLRRAQGKTKEAEELFKRSLEERPDQPHVQHNLGNLLRIDGRHDEGIAALREAIRLKPNYAEAWFNLGLAYFGKRALEDAEKAYRQALKLQPNYAMAKQNLAVVLNELNRPREAEAILIQALNAGSRDRNLLAGYQHNLAVSARLQRRYEDALRWYEGAQAMSPELPNADYNRANMLQTLGREDEAIIAYRRALARNPLDINVHRDLNLVLYRRGNDEEFLRSLDDAASIYPEKSSLLLAKGQMLSITGEHDQALKAFACAREIEPENPALRHASAAVLARMGRFNEAIAEHESALKPEPENPFIWRSYTETLLRARNIEKALTAAEKSIALEPDNQGTLALWGLALRASGDPREAWLNDYENLVQVFELAPPDGYPSMESFNRDLEAYLASLYREARAFPDQSLQGGTQTGDGVFGSGHVLLERLRMRIDEAINAYIARMKDDKDHPLFRRRGAGFAYAGSWASRLNANGHFANHVHPTGWISSAYYASADNSGALQFGEPNFEMGLKPRHSVQPKAGTLVLFPSYMWHGTAPVSTPRTSIAFDVVPR